MVRLLDGIVLALFVLSLLCFGKAARGAECQPCDGIREHIYTTKDRIGWCWGSQVASTVSYFEVEIESIDTRAQRMPDGRLPREVQFLSTTVCQFSIWGTSHHRYRSRYTPYVGQDPGVTEKWSTWVYVTADIDGDGSGEIDGFDFFSFRRAFRTGLVDFDDFGDFRHLFRSLPVGNGLYLAPDPKIDEWLAEDGGM